MTKSENTAAYAAELYQEGKVREAIQKLVDFADTGIQNQHTAVLFKNAIDKEFAGLVDDVNKPDDDAPKCTHCGSTSTWWRSDGDVACNDCPGIMPQEETPDGKNH